MEKLTTIGILTFHNANNYGAVLQAYALQTYLGKDDFTKVEIIDFCTKAHIKSARIFKRKSENGLKNIILQALTCLRYIPLHKKKMKFESFRQDFLHLSKHKYTSERDFLTNISPYDVYISGSDQVFNPNIEFSQVYYLNFHPSYGKKIAYAPSFGISTFNDEIKNKILPFLQDFQSLSCRENVGAQYMSKILKKNIPTVLDPVFLIKKEEWESIMKIPEENYKYIFVYDLCGGKELIKISKRLKEITGLKIICATAHTKEFYSGCKSKYSIGPLELLGYINRAEYVVTDSFHGTSLSIILNTKVLSYIALPHVSNRITSIMEQLHIKDQIITNVNNFNFSSIKFTNYQTELQSLISSSKNYLKKALNN